MAAELTREAFQSVVGTTFRVGTTDLRLTKVADRGSANGFEQFSLFFEGPGGDRALDQGLHEFRHETFGTIELFIVPVLGSTAERMIYEAAFSRAIR